MNKQNIKITDKKNELECFQKLDLVGALLLYRLLPAVTWTKSLPFTIELFYGMSNGICFYPFKPGNWKIGFLCLEHRSYEIIPKIIHIALDKLGRKFSKSWLRGLGLFPIDLSLISVKWKCLKMNTLVFSPWKFWEGYGKKYESVYFSLISPPDWIEWFWLFLPQISIDMSYLLQNDEDEETEKVF